MFIDPAGIAAGYQGYANETARLANEDRLTKAEARAEQDAQFTQQARERQRADWAEQDRIKAADKADIAAINAKYDNQSSTSASDLEVAKQQAAQDKMQSDVSKAMDSDANAGIGFGLGGIASPAPAGAQDSVVVSGGAPSWAQSNTGAAAVPADGGATGAAAPADNSLSPKLAPDVAAKYQQLQATGGIPAPHNFNNTLAKMADRLRLKSDRGDMTPEAYTQGMAMIDQFKKQGVNDALDLASQGRYAEAMDKFNSTGNMSGSRLIDGSEGSTKINGVDSPTHFLTIANPDGSRTTIDTTKARYQLLDINSQLQHQDRARQTGMQEKQHAETIALGRDQLAQSAKDAAASRGLQAQALQLQLKQFNATTPLGQITSMGEALGRQLTRDEIENRLGLSRIPRAVELQVQSLMKESDTEAAAMAKAIASPEGMNPNASALFQKNAAIRNAKLGQLLAPYSPGGGKTASADPLNIKGALTGTAPAGGTTVANPYATGAGASVGGVQAAVNTAKSTDIPEPPTQKAWVGNSYLVTPEYEAWQRQYGAAYKVQQEKQERTAVGVLDRARPY